MKVVAILGGLGSQMFKYAFFLGLKGTDECYIDTTPYQLLDMWNGYELQRIFGIQEQDILHSLSETELENIRNQGMNYKEVAQIAISKLDSHKPIVSFFRGYWYPQSKDKILLFISLICNKIKRICNKNNNICDSYPLFYKTKLFSIYYDEFNHTSDQYLGAGKNREELIKVFQFPDFSDKRNIDAAMMIRNSESVALHVRRGDHMYDNVQLFENGYFKKAIKYIKDNAKHPIFFLFSDEPDWCRNNLEALGFNVNDEVEIVDWNCDNQSFRDMQLMTYCKHNILVISSFSWWGYYLSKRQGKIVCAPRGYWLEVPVHF